MKYLLSLYSIKRKPKYMYGQTAGTRICQIGSKICDCRICQNAFWRNTDILSRKVLCLLTASDRSK